MKTLVFMRHLKAVPQGAMEDFDRPLAEHRKTDMNLVAAELRKTGFRPDMVLASPTKRTRQTAALFCKETGFPEQEITSANAIYEASVEDLLHVIADLNDQVNSVLLVGHNPSFTSIIATLTDSRIDHVPTGGVAGLLFHAASWKDVVVQKGVLSFFIVPKWGAVELR
ncbi:MAG: histidine phosphatase family protein [Chitinophagales bacterium]